MAKQRLDTIVLDLIEQAARNSKGTPLNLGGVSGAGGGVGTVPGGFIGKLPQTKVAYDTTEAATLYTPASGQSLLDNLNHIRYRLDIIESGGSITVIDDTTETTFLDVDTIHFSGAVVIDDLGSGDIRISISGGGSSLTLEELDGSPSIANVDKIVFSGAVLTDLGAGDVLVQIAGGGGGAVDSVNGYTGVVVLQASDLANTPAGGISSSNLQGAINELDGEKATVASLSAHTGNTSNPHSVTAAQVAAIPNDGWIPGTGTWSYSSVDDPTGVIATSVDQTSLIGVGDRIRFVNNSNTIYGIVTAITSSLITFLHEIDPADSLARALLNNSAITVPHYSHVKIPYGFPATPDKWTVYVVDTTNATQASPGSTTYNLGTILIAIPIGSWYTGFFALTESAINLAATQLRANNAGLSTSNSSYSDLGLKDLSFLTVPASATATIRSSLKREKLLNLASKTTYYLIANAAGTTGPTSLSFRGDLIDTRIDCVCAYL